jgi:phage repressor protein C with HTH and peptisase S24 domain
MWRGNQLSKARQAQRRQQSEIAEVTGVTARTVSRWENDQSVPDIDQVVKMAKFLEVPVEFLTGDEPQSIENSTILNGALLRDSGTIGRNPGVFSESNVRPIANLIQIPIISPRATLCCGSGNGLEGVEPEVTNRLPMDLDTIEVFGINASDLRVMKTEGDSMEPIIRDGDFVIFGKGSDVRHGDIGVVEYRGRWYVRGVLIEPEEKIILRSKNQAEYPDIVVKWGDEQYREHGRVLHIQTPVRRCPGIL